MKRYTHSIQVDSSRHFLPHGVRHLTLNTEWTHVEGEELAGIFVLVNGCRDDLLKYRGNALAPFVITRVPRTDMILS